jgi:hypothetical protein
VDGGYVAGEELYLRFGLRPAKIVVSLEQETRRRLRDGDPSLAKEVLRGVAPLLAVGGDDTTVEEEAHAVADATLLRKVVPPHLGTMQALITCTLRDDPDESLKAVLAEWVKMTERTAESRNACVAILFDHKRSTANEVSRLLERTLTDAQLPWRGRQSAVRTQPGDLFSFLSIELEEDEIVEAVFRARNMRHGDLLEGRVANALKKHFRSLEKELPVLVPDAFAGDSLGRLIASAGEIVTFEIRGADSAETRGALEALEALGAIRRESRGQYVWSLRGDTFLDRLRAFEGSSGLDEFSKHYQFDRGRWRTIARAAAQAYGRELVALEGDRLLAQDPAPVLRGRLAGLQESAKRDIATLAEFGGDITVLCTRFDEVAPEDDPVALDEAIETMVRLRELARIETEASRQRSEQQRAEVARRQAELRTIARSFDQVLDEQRNALVLREIPTAPGDIAAILTELNACANVLRTVERERERNLREAQEIRTELDRLKTDARQLAGPQEDPSRRGRAQEIVTQAATLETNVPGKIHPEDAPTNVQHALDGIRRQSAELRLRLMELATAPAPEPVRPPSAEPARIEMLVFTTAQEDLERLADVYRSARKIRRVEVIR